MTICLLIAVATGNECAVSVVKKLLEPERHIWNIDEESEMVFHFTKPAGASLGHFLSISPRM
jgi:hypothetical protein